MRLMKSLPTVSGRRRSAAQVLAPCVRAVYGEDRPGVCAVFKNGSLVALVDVNHPDTADQLECISVVVDLGNQIVQTGKDSGFEIDILNSASGGGLDVGQYTVCFASVDDTVNPTVEEDETIAALVMLAMGYATEEQIKQVLPGSTDTAFDLALLTTETDFVKLFHPGQK